MLSRQYDEFAWNFSRLGRAHRDGQLVFVVGAGIEKPYGHPEWAALLNRLLLQSGRVPRLGHGGSAKRPHDADLDAKLVSAERSVIKAVFERLAPDPLMQGNIARAAYPSSVWPQKIRAQLDRTTTPEGSEDPGVLGTIATMLVASLKRNRKRHLSVLSFNYDSMLDRAVQKELEANGLSVSLLKSVKDGVAFEQSWMDAGIYIYHLHGYLDASQPEPVLDGDSYVPVLRGDHWSWRCMERALTAAGNVSLFLGLSLADPSLSYVLLRWKSWQTSVTGVYLAPPAVLPFVDCGDPRAVALLYRSIMDLYSSVLDRLHLICYHLSSWSEIEPILKFVGEFK